MKRILTFILTAALVLSATACNSKESGRKKHVFRDIADDRATATTETDPVMTETDITVTDTVPTDTDPTTPPTTPPSNNGLIKVGIVSLDPNESAYRTAMDNDLKQIFTKEQGYDTAFAYSMKNDEQIHSARAFIKDRCDFLLICAADSAGWDGVLQEAKAAGIAVILYDREIDADPSLYYSIVMSDLKICANKAVELLESEGLPEYNILHLQGIMGSMAQEARTEALEAKISTNSDWCIVGQKCCEWDEQRASAYVSAMIAAGEKFNVIYAENDNMARGAATALDNAGISHGVGKDVLIVSFGGAYWAMEELLAGNWNYEVLDNPFVAAYLDSIIKDMLSGYQTPNNVTMEVLAFDAKTITFEDLEKYGMK